MNLLFSLSEDNSLVSYQNGRWTRCETSQMWNYRRLLAHNECVSFIAFVIARRPRNYVTVPVAPPLQLLQDYFGVICQIQILITVENAMPLSMVVSLPFSQCSPTWGFFQSTKNETIIMSYKTLWYATSVFRNRVTVLIIQAFLRIEVSVYMHTLLVVSYSDYFLVSGREKYGLGMRLQFGCDHG